eukprot:CAMPEP_0178735580 /NCGR_PEP_ID=MMETSP0744-20121128/1967_1 /TAXON_ID=913974 /ORGANISM="Nitzschia punctata, Strain CCMP561" /LENGTH=75 /DNA_ID=CAMNT_0020387965 /DNA_START=669 /DNA_END=893 /DNA_ORIENTATION=-
MDGYNNSAPCWNGWTVPPPPPSSTNSTENNNNGYQFPWGQNVEQGSRQGFYQQQANYLAAAPSNYFYGQNQQQGQ